MKQKAFFVIFKELWMKQITKSFLEGESPSLITPIDSTNDQNIVTIERVNFPSYMIFPWVM